MCVFWALIVLYIYSCIRLDVWASVCEHLINHNNLFVCTGRLGRRRRSDDDGFFLTRRHQAYAGKMLGTPTHIAWNEYLRSFLKLACSLKRNYIFLEISDLIIHGRSHLLQTLLDWYVVFFRCPGFGWRLVSALCMHVRILPQSRRPLKMSPTSRRGTESGSKSLSLTAELSFPSLLVSLFLALISVHDAYVYYLYFIQH